MAQFPNDLVKRNYFPSCLNDLISFNTGNWDFVDHKSAVSVSFDYFGEIFHKLDTKDSQYIMVEYSTFLHSHS